jgi:beta-glucanase (GH16 family)
MIRRSVLPVAAAVLLTVALSAPDDGRASAAPAATQDRGTAILGSTTSWTPSGNARVKRVAPVSARIVQLTPRKAAGRKTVSMRSSVSAAAVDAVGTMVKASARLRVSQPGRRLTLTVLEIKDRAVVARRSTTVKPSGRSWTTVAVSLRTTRAGSRIRVQAQAKRLSGAPTVRLAGLDVRATPPTVTTAATPPTPTPARTAAPCSQIDYSEPDQGVRTFTEDFDGTEIDRSRWRVRDNTFLNQDQAWITKDAVTVHDGYLDIAGRKLSVAQSKMNLNALYPGVNTLRDYSTGYIDTIDTAGYGNAAGDRFGQKYGHFEIRAWVPSEATMSRGIWPAFWLRADHQPGEIDPMESYGAPSIRSFDPSSSYEWNSWADTSQGSSTGPKQMTQGRADVGTDKIWQGWHTYGVNWSPGCLRYLYDGRTVGVVEFDDPTTQPYFRGPTFDDTFHLRLNMQVGSNYWGWADDEHTRPEFSYRVDWVRVYQGRELLGR